MGVLIGVARETASLRPDHRARVASAGRRQLEERTTGKRAWKSWSRTKELHSVTLSAAQIREIVGALNGRAPKDKAQLISALENFSQGDDA